MKEYATEFIRNVALVSHSGGGKTSLGEGMLHLTGAITRMGKVEDGNTVSDFEEEEIRRSLSLSTSRSIRSSSGRYISIRLTTAEPEAGGLEMSVAIWTVSRSARDLI